MQHRDENLADVYKADFLDECYGGQCDAAVANLFSSLDGNHGLFGCDLMQIFYEGDMKGDYYQGWRDEVQSKAAYVLTLITQGLTIVSTYNSLQSSNPLAWTMIQN